MHSTNTVDQNRAYTQSSILVLVLRHELTLCDSTVCVRVCVINTPACVDKDGGTFHLGEEVLVTDLLCLWC